jgi:polyphosphate kinase 2 (PPK2 family)
VNPQGCQVFSFKTPSAEEQEHDFLSAPTAYRRGADRILKRSYYEECSSWRAPGHLKAQALQDEAA